MIKQQDQTTDQTTISKFKGSNLFLSNFYPHEITVWDKTYPSAEHAFQAKKAATEEDHERVRAEKTPFRAKRLAQRIPLREDWTHVKVAVMEEVLRAKFAQPKMLQRLLATGNSTLIEGNDWGDRFFGCVKDENGHWQGESHLGKLLMKLRDEFRASTRL
jgi:ribA/ribD-fused uncharacterized protein